MSAGLELYHGHNLIPVESHACSHWSCIAPDTIVLQSLLQLAEPGHIDQSIEMRIPRIYTPQTLTPGAQLTITGQSAHHVIHVLRLRSGAPVRIFDGNGTEHNATLINIKRSEIILETGQPVTVIPESSLQVTLLQGIARNDRMDLILQKAVELGVQNFQPLWMQRSQSRLKNDRLEKRINHWRGIITSACEQCGRATMPVLESPVDFTEWLGTATYSGLYLMLQPDCETSLCNIENPRENIHILVGPEGGLSADEQVLARNAKFQGVHLGPRVLRTETAALAALSGMQTLWGDFN